MAAPAASSTGGRIPTWGYPTGSSSSLGSPPWLPVRDMHVAKREEDIGFYAGFLGASYMVGRGFASIFWGIVADKFGRKPVITFAMLSVVILNTLFGLSTKYWMAITTRLLLGALNGLLGPIKAYSIEVCRTEHQAVGLSIVNTAWGIGLIVGPALGGYFAQPAEKYPHIFPTKSIFGRIPYLLPSLVVSVFAAIVLMSCIWLPETIHKHKHTDQEVQPVEDFDSPRRKSLFENRPWMSSVISYCIFALHDTAYSEILSLWAVSDRKYGGLSFSTEDIGQVLGVAGASLLVYQLFIYRWVDKILGPVNSSRVASALSIIILATYPFMTYLSGFKLYLALYPAVMMKSILAITVTTGVTLLQNNVVAQEQRGAANGISTTAMSLFKAIGPVGAGTLISWAQKHQNSAFFPGDQMVFLMLNLVELVGLMLTFKPFLVVPQRCILK